MYASLLFDVEDYITPPEFGLDDIPRWLAEIMTEEGITGTFLVIGNKAGYPPPAGPTQPHLESNFLSTTKSSAWRVM